MTGIGETVYNASGSPFNIWYSQYFYNHVKNDLELNANWNKWEYNDIEIILMIMVADLYPPSFCNDDTPAVSGAEN